MQAKTPHERPFLLRFLTCLVRRHRWDPYPGHLKDENLMECAACGLRAAPVHGLRNRSPSDGISRL